MHRVRLEVEKRCRGELCKRLVNQGKSRGRICERQEIQRLFEIRNLKLFIVLYMNKRPIEGEGVGSRNFWPSTSVLVSLFMLEHFACLVLLN